ncbi:Flagellar M-ring protein FliF [Roseibacterium elongatum DSM 19469]|uniref:Flagellar M-ring protein n=1 Tax=Roseicyclus elongatus DSM 19469 TaxID=1294273 RepID=W8S0P0_9RHOB|nr:flagellar basal-body MS-ring/collar protein FliF [Roseibacterium elongatum]AHM03722.1 Flagellar M-ring protein FliF [Roseibacterium elongatum DSM 19469]
MENTLTKFWGGLDTRRRAFLVGGGAALLVVVVILARVATAPSYALLYSGLDPAAAGEVVTALEARGVPFRVSGTAIEVEASQRDSLRMALAGDGLPANGPQGYELLDSLSGFGTTSQMFDAAYWRAKEGELSRTILASPRIRAARVHIANPSSDPFQPERAVTASVALRPAAGGLAPGHAQALRYLVASSVPGLSPENVTVIDADSGHVLGGEDRLTPAADAAGRADSLRLSIERLLAARVGPGNAVVQVSVELDTARETILERVIDPDSRVVIATETEEREDASRDGGGARGDVTVASNLPDGDAQEGDGSTAQSTETRERVSYDLSETQREVERAPGAVRRISVAVLLNGIPDAGTDGAVRLVPRPAEEIAALEALVRSAVGYDAARGDTVTIESMAFDASAVTGLQEAGFTDRMNLDMGRVVQSVVLGAVALAIAFGLLRPLLRADPAVSGDMARIESDGSRGDAALQPTLTAPAAPDAPATPPPLAAGMSAMGLPADTMPGLPAPDPGLPQTGASGAEPLPLDPVERLRRLIEEREEETVEILRSWMEEDEEDLRQ